MRNPDGSWKGRKGNMCGRYSLFTDEQNKEILKIIQEVSAKHPSVEMKTGEIFPTNIAPILKQENGSIHPDAAIWGFPHFKNKGVIINARSETAFEKKMFRESLIFRRCVIPSTGFYEWSQDEAHQKYRFLLPQSNVLYMAGIYNEYKGEQRYVILTTEGNESIREIHHRMPVVLLPNQIEQWIEDSNSTSEILRGEFPSLVYTVA